MKKHFTMLALLLVAAQNAFAQPTVNGNNTGDSDYISLGTWTQANTGFGDWGIKELYGYKTATDLYLFLKGVPQNNCNPIVIYVNHSGATGVAANTTLPVGNDGLSVFSSLTPKLDMEVDFGIRMANCGDGNAYTSIIDYRSGGNTDTYIGGPVANGTVQAVTSGPYNGASFAYNRTATGVLSTHDGVSGFEIKIPRSAFGASKKDANPSFNFLAVYTSGGGFVSANTIPEIAGQSGTNLANDPDFFGIAGSQNTANNTLPVTLTSLSNQVNGNDAAINWTVASESNISRYEVEQNVNNAWKVVAQVSASAVANYTAEVKGLSAGLHNFRLVAVEKDGSRTVYGNTTVLVEVPGTHVVQAAYPNPFASTATLEFAVAKTQNVTIEIFNVLGQKVAVAFEGAVDANSTKAVALNAETLQSGTYFVRISGEGFVETQRINVVK